MLRFNGPRSLTQSGTRGTHAQTLNLSSSGFSDSKLKTKQLGFFLNLSSKRSSGLVTICSFGVLDQLYCTSLLAEFMLKDKPRFRRDMESCQASTVKAERPEHLPAPKEYTIATNHIMDRIHEQGLGEKHLLPCHCLGMPV